MKNLKEFLVILIYSKGFSSNYLKLEKQLKKLKYDYFSIKLEDYCIKKNIQNWNEKNKFYYYAFKPLLIKEIISKKKNYKYFFYLDTNDLPLKGLKEYVIYSFEKYKSIDFIVPSSKNSNLLYSHFHRIKKLNFFSIILELFNFQLEAGSIAIKNNNSSIKLIEEWYYETINLAELNIKFPSKTSRHDQEILTKLRLHYKSIKAESWMNYKLNKSCLRNFIKYEFFRKNEN